MYELQAALTVTGLVFMVLTCASGLVINGINKRWGWLMFWVCFFISSVSYLGAAWIPVFV